jgi:hypothetical protein
MVTDEMFYMQDGDDFDGQNMESHIDNEKMNDFIKSFEEGLEKKRKPSQKVGLEKFFEE